MTYPLATSDPNEQRIAAEAAERGKSFMHHPHEHKHTLLVAYRIWELKNHSQETSEAVALSNYLEAEALLTLYHGRMEPTLHHVEELYRHHDLSTRTIET